MNSDALKEDAKDLVARVLLLAVEGSESARSGREPPESRESFYRLKDLVMATLHRTLGNAGRVRYRRIPYLRRCGECKARADQLHALDPSRRWEDHLAALPVCGDDVELVGRSTIEQCITWAGREYALRIPLPKAESWGLETDQLETRPWLPDAGPAAADVGSSGRSLAVLTGELQGRLHFFACFLEEYVRDHPRPKIDDDRRPATPPENGPSSPRRVDMLPWFAAEDRSAAEQVLRRLPPSVSVWQGWQRAGPEQEKEAEIFAAIPGCRALAVFLSAGAIQRPQTERVIQYAAASGKAIVYFHLEPLFLPKRLQASLSAAQHIRLYERDLEAALRDVQRPLAQLFQRARRRKRSGGCGGKR